MHLLSLGQRTPAEMLKSQRTIVSMANNEIVICLEDPTADLLEQFEGKLEPFITR